MDPCHVLDLSRQDRHPPNQLRLKIAKQIKSRARRLAPRKDCQQIEHTGSGKSDHVGCETAFRD
jgi:hypothetical protein